MAHFDELSFKDVDIIQTLWNNYSISLPNLAKLFSVSDRTINKVLSGTYVVKGALECDSETDSGGVRDDRIAEEAPPFCPENTAGDEPLPLPEDDWLTPEEEADIVDQIKGSYYLQPNNIPEYIQNFKSCPFYPYKESKL